MTRFLDALFLAAAVIATAGMLVMQCGCASRPQAVEPVRHETPYCFRLTFAFDGKDQAGLACGASAKLCESARGKAMQWGAVMGANEVGACRRE